MAGEREENDDQPLLVRYAAQSPVTARRSLWPLTLNRARHTEASHAQQRQIVPVSMSILLVLISPFSSFFCVSRQDAVVMHTAWWRQNLDLQIDAC